MTPPTSEAGGSQSTANSSSNVDGNTGAPTTENTSPLGNLSHSIEDMSLEDLFHYDDFISTANDGNENESEEIDENYDWKTIRKTTRAQVTKAWTPISCGQYVPKPSLTLQVAINYRNILTKCMLYDDDEKDKLYMERLAEITKQLYMDERKVKLRASMSSQPGSQTNNNFVSGNQSSTSHTSATVTLTTANSVVSSQSSCVLTTTSLLSSLGGTTTPTVYSSSSASYSPLSLINLDSASASNISSPRMFAPLPSHSSATSTANAH